MKIYFLFPIICTLSLLTACAPDISSDHYVVERIGCAQQVRYGKIVNAKLVDVASHHDETGSLVGVAAGATAGSAIGNSSQANILGALGGAVVGGLTGREIGKRLGDQKAMQYIIHLDNGKVFSIVQGLRPLLHVGQRVMLLTGGKARDRVIAA